MTLARSSVGKVEICRDCNVVHLSLNYMSVRLAPETFHALALMCAEAEERLAHAGAAAAAAAALIKAARNGGPIH